MNSSQEQQQQDQQQPSGTGTPPYNNNISYTRISIHLPFVSDTSGTTTADHPNGLGQEMRYSPEQSSTSHHDDASNQQGTSSAPNLDGLFSLLAPMLFGPPAPSAAPIVPPPMFFYQFGMPPSSFGADPSEDNNSTTPGHTDDVTPSPEPDQGESHEESSLPGENENPDNTSPQDPDRESGPPPTFVQVNIPGHISFRFVNVGGQMIMIPMFIPSSQPPSLQGQPPASKYALEHQIITKTIPEELSTTTQESHSHAQHPYGSCAICLDDYTPGITVSELPCQHQYHPECINEWLKCSNMCPQCRHELLTDNEEYNVGVQERMKARVEATRQQTSHKEYDPDTITQQENESEDPVKSFSPEVPSTMTSEPVPMEIDSNGMSGAIPSATAGSDLQHPDCNIL